MRCLWQNQVPPTLNPRSLAPWRGAQHVPEVLCRCAPCQALLQVCLCFVQALNCDVPLHPDDASAKNADDGIFAATAACSRMTVLGAACLGKKNSNVSN
jgi:hypothetical protein